MSFFVYPIIIQVSGFYHLIHRNLQKIVTTIDALCNVIKKRNIQDFTLLVE